MNKILVSGKVEGIVLKSNDPIEKSKTGLGLGVFIGKTLSTPTVPDIFLIVNVLDKPRPLT